MEEARFGERLADPYPTLEDIFAELERDPPSFEPNQVEEILYVATPPSPSEQCSYEHNKSTPTNVEKLSSRISDARDELLNPQEVLHPSEPVNALENSKPSAVDPSRNKNTVAESANAETTECDYEENLSQERSDGEAKRTEDHSSPNRTIGSSENRSREETLYEYLNLPTPELHDGCTQPMASRTALQEGHLEEPVPNFPTEPTDIALQPHILVPAHTQTNWQSINQNTHGSLVQVSAQQIMPLPVQSFHPCLPPQPEQMPNPDEISKTLDEVGMPRSFAISDTNRNLMRDHLRFLNRDEAPGIDFQNASSATQTEQRLNHLHPAPTANASTFHAVSFANNSANRNLLDHGSQETLHDVYQYIQQLNAKPPIPYNVLHNNGKRNPDFNSPDQPPVKRACTSMHLAENSSIQIAELEATKQSSENLLKQGSPQFALSLSQSTCEPTNYREIPRTVSINERGSLSVSQTTRNPEASQASLTPDNNARDCVEPANEATKKTTPLSRGEIVREERKDMPKRFSCVRCASIFAFKENCERHYKVVHEERKVFFCPHCPLTYLQAKTMRNHIDKNHCIENGALIFPCYWCKFKTNTEMLWTDHVVEMHPGNKKTFRDGA